MKFRSHMQADLLAALALVLFLLPAGHAQNSDSIRVARVSRIEGQVLLSHSGSDAWEDALVNEPVEEGDALATQAGMVEIEFESGATAYLAENSVLQFTQLAFSGGGRLTRLTLTQGAGNFYANLTRQDSFSVVTSIFDVAIPERAEVRIDAFRDGASAQVLTGNVSVGTTGRSVDLAKGQSVAVHDRDFHDFSIGSLPTAEDAFDQWVTEEGEKIRAGNNNTLSYINSPSLYGLSDLSMYGSWFDFPGYGFSWRPFSVGLSWTPFFNGIWKLDPRLGWIWVSNEQWGWMPFHFGSWLLSPTLGWVWVPGGPAGLRQWEPARVNWVRVGNQVGWVAKNPNDREGAPANLAQGVMTKSFGSARNGAASNELVTGKDLRSATPLKQPPAEFASRPVPSAPRSGATSTIRVRGETQPSDRNESIVFDNRTHTFINRDGGRDSARDGSDANVTRATGRAPVPPAALMPPPNAQNQVPRITIPPSGRADSQIHRVILPPAYPTNPALRGIVPGNGLNNIPHAVPMTGPLPSRLPMSGPGTQPRSAIPPVAPPPVAPRPVMPPAAPVQPQSPHPAPAPSGSGARSATPEPQHVAPPGQEQRR